MSTRDNEAAREEDQETASQQGMSPRGGSGPTPASTADAEGAFGDAKGRSKTSATADSLNEGPMVFDDTPDPRPR